MANEQNLKKNSERTPSERRELAKKAGKASGKARREKATIKQYLKWMLEEGDYDGRSGAEAIASSAVYKAIHGDVKAMTFVRDTVGEKPVDKVQVNKISQEAKDEVEALFNDKRRSHQSAD